MSFSAVSFPRNRAPPPSPPQAQSNSVSLDRDTVKTIAYLARVRVADDQLDALSRELSGILHWVEQLDSAPTDGVAPMTSVAAMTLALREDRVNDGGDARSVLANAPADVDDFFSVPKVVE